GTRAPPPRPRPAGPAAWAGSATRRGAARPPSVRPPRVSARPGRPVTRGRAPWRRTPPGRPPPPAARPSRAPPPAPAALADQRLRPAERAGIAHFHHVDQRREHGPGGLGPVAEQAVDDVGRQVLAQLFGCDAGAVEERPSLPPPLQEALLEQAVQRGHQGG